MTKSQIFFIAKIIGLFLIVPYLLARLTIAGLGVMYPPPEPKFAAG